MNYALVNSESGVVENVIILEEGAQWTPPDGMNLVLLQGEFGIGDTWDGSQFIRAPEPVSDSEEIQPISNGTQIL